uniref:WxxW domain-containing protein n=1 Tax=Strongyloides stercoralis TaxID=6248 RepID=A0A0K0ESF1_STRER
MIRFQYYLFLLIKLPLVITVVLVSTPFDNFRIECPQRYGVQRLNIRMAESQGYKRTDAVFSISCGNIQDLSPWDTIPDSIADMEYEDCHYTESFDPILEKHKNVTCGIRKYLSGITRISGTKTSLMCCKLRTRDISKCTEKEFNKPLDNVGFVEIQHDGMLINSIIINDNSYLIKFCSFMPRAVGFIYDEIATSTPRPTTIAYLSTTKMVTKTLTPIENYSQSTFPRLISENELKSISSQNNNLIQNNKFENTQYIKDESSNSNKYDIDDMINQEFIPMKIDFEEKNYHQITTNESDIKKNDNESIKLLYNNNSTINNNHKAKNNLSILPELKTSKSFENINSQTYHQKLELINDELSTETTTLELEKDKIGDKSTINVNSNENTLLKIEGINNLSITNSSQRPLYNSQYKHIQTDPIVIEEEIISNHSNQLKSLKSSEKKELHSSSFENNSNTLNSFKSNEGLPYPIPFTTISKDTLQSLLLTSTPSSDKVDIAKATVAKLHYSLKYNKKYNHNKSAFGSKTFKALEDNEVKQKNQTTDSESLTTTTIKYSTTPYIPRMNKKLINNNKQKSIEISTEKPIMYKLSSPKSQDIIKTNDSSNNLTLNNDKNIIKTSTDIKSTYTNKELNEMEKNTNLMISQIDEFAKIPFDETFVPKDYSSSSEKNSENIKTPIQEAINEQYHFNGYPTKDSNTKMKYYQPPVEYRKSNKSYLSSSYHGIISKEDNLEESNNFNKGPLVDEDTDNSPFDDSINESLFQSQKEIKSSNLKNIEELESAKGIDKDIIPQNYLTSHDIRRAPQKTYTKDFYHPKALESTVKISPTLPPLTIFKYEHKESPMPLQPLTVIKENIDITKIKDNNDDSLTTPLINSEYLLRDNNSNNKDIEKNFNIPLTLEKINTSLLTTTEVTTKYNANVFYKVPKIKIPRKKEKYLTFCTKEEAIRDENNLVIACGGDYDIWIPPRCPQGSSCFLTNDSTYRICCPVSSG